MSGSSSKDVMNPVLMDMGSITKARIDITSRKVQVRIALLLLLSLLLLLLLLLFIYFKL